jgi:hypothetical protein
MIILTSASHHRVELMLPVLLDLEAIARATRTPDDGLLGDICAAAGASRASDAVERLKTALLRNRQSLDGLLGPVSVRPSHSPNGLFPERSAPSRLTKGGKRILAALRAAAELITDDDRFYGHEFLLQDATCLTVLFEELAGLSALLLLAESLVHGRYHASDVQDLSFLLTLFVVPARMPALFQTLSTRLRVLWQRQYFVTVDGQPLLWSANRRA